MQWEFLTLTLDLQDLGPLLGTLVKVGILAPDTVNIRRLDQTDNHLNKGLALDLWKCPEMKIKQEKLPLQLPTFDDEYDSISF